MCTCCGRRATPVFYIGFSTNLRARLRQHQASESFATKSRGPWKLVYYEAYLNQEDALGREKYLRVDQADDFSERNSDIICCKNPPLDRVAQRHRMPRVFTRKSGAGRRLKLGRFPHSLAASLAALPSMSLIPFAPFLRAQLRHYLRVKGPASRGSNQDGPTAH